MNELLTLNTTTMERNTSPQPLKTFFILFLFFCSTVNAVTYTSINAGTWNNTTNVWSLDGVTPCGCTPGSISGGNDIVVNHLITLSYNLSFSAGSTILVNPTGSLTGPYILTPWNSTLVFMGDIIVARFSQGVGTNTTLTNGAVLSLTDRFILHGGVFTCDNALISMPSGNFDVTSASAILNVINGSKVDIYSGNIRNDGQIFIDATSCVTTTGNWRNEATGIVSGSGSATSTTGNMGNLGVWDVNIRWCSNGSDFGMPSPEDCANASAVCGVIVLPVELLSFIAKSVGTQIHLSWLTATERDNDYFLIQRSANGEDWIDLGVVDGVGSSQIEVDYEFQDQSPVTGINYYRLIQVDNNGQRSLSEVVSAEIRSQETILECYPNPVESGSLLYLKNLDSVNGELVIYDLNGTMVFQDMISNETNTIQLPALQGGLYLIHLRDRNTIKSAKLMVR